MLLVVFCLASYVLIINELVYWTNWSGSAGEVGGVLEYSPFWRITIDHVIPVDLTYNNAVDGELFSIFDFTAFLLVAVVILNIVYLIPRNKKERFKKLTQDLAISNVLLASFSLFFYEWWIIFLTDFLKKPPNVGGVIMNVYPTILGSTHVALGSIDSSVNTGPFPDLPLYFIFMLLAFASAMLINALKGTEQSEP